MPEWIVKATLCGIADDLLVNLSGNALHDYPRMDHSLTYPLTQQGRFLVQVCGKSTHAGQPVFIVLQRLKAERTAQVVNVLRAFTLVETHQVPMEFVLFQAVQIALLKEVIVELVGLVQSFAVDLRQLSKHLP